MKKSKLLFFGVNTLLMMSLLLMSFVQAYSQNDTSAPQTVTIISAFQPEVKPPAKINLSGTQLTADTTKLVKPYNVPVQQLVYHYQPVVLNAISLSHDNEMDQGARYIAKAGFGNLTTPFLEGAARFGDEETYQINAFGNYVSSKGKIKNQNYAFLNVNSTASYALTNQEIYGGIGYSRRQYYQYGYDHTLYDLDKKQVNQQFNDFQINAGFRNTSQNDLGIDYHPTINLSLFNKKDSLTENTIQVKLPAERKFGDNIIARVELNLDNTRYHTKNFYQGDFAIINNVFGIHPSGSYLASWITANAGFSSVRSFKKWVVLPDLSVKLPVPGTKFNVQAGWTGKVIKNTIKNLSQFNPYINTLPDQVNTTEREIYGGISATVGKHFNISCKASYFTYNNFQLFINDTSVANDNKGFLTTYEPTVHNFRLHGDISFLIQDYLSITGSININAYGGLKSNVKAWNTVPMECNVHASWNAMKKLVLKSDLMVFGGGYYLDKGNVARSFHGAADLSFGGEYAITKSFGAFINLNNIFGKNYERWHNYPVYGINVIGGLSCRF